MSPTQTSYRPDLDGLRAIAVLSVIAFHVENEKLAGGYLGVDIFFVLSGYLITQVIQGEILGGHFTVAGFYERRVRRIVPALLVVLAFCSVVASAILLPADLTRFGKALLATLAFVPNIFAWLDTSYFSPLADQKPLLHTWSLGVEEQFYILFPLILLLLARRWPRLTLPTIIVVACASFAINWLAYELGSGNAPFFLLPTRAWELGIGAILALAPRRVRAPSSSSLLLTMLGVLGLALIAWGLLSPSQVDRPVVEATLVVAGTALLVSTGQQGDGLISQILGSRPLVWVGLISYSLYLWHWPVIVFSKYYLVRELRPLESAAAVVFSFVAAALSWRFVEQPFRRREYPVRRLYLGSAVGAVVLAVIGLALLQYRGMPARLSADTVLMNEAVGTHFQCARGDKIGIGYAHVCGLNLPSRNPADARLVLFGSSHAQMYAPVWRDILAERGEPGLLVPMIGCLPTVSANFSVGCAHLARTRLDLVNQLPNVRTVVLAMTWWPGEDGLVDPSGLHVDNRDKAALIAALDDVITRLNERGRRVVLIGPIAVPGWNVASEVSRRRAFGWPLNRPLAQPKAEFDREYAAVMSHFSGREDVAFVRPDLVQCDAESCRYTIDGRSLFSDSNHLAAAEVGRFRDIFAAVLK